ncbi:MAG: hypothetical protein U9N14_04540, partial [Pseudomonadota bacterium]|nr:hypothetical protein [Pseudomonadota bacterium]
MFRSQEDQITKYIHKDGSETCIKTIPSVDGRLDSKTGIVSELKEDRNKVSVFLSASKGCPMNCTFCSLTVNAVS